MLDEMDALLWMAARHSFIRPEQRRVPAVRERRKWEFTHAEARFCEILGDRPFAMGAATTVPDIIAAHCGLWAGLAKFPVTADGFRDYPDRMCGRAAMQRAMAH